MAELTLHTPVSKLPGIGPARETALAKLLPRTHNGAVVLLHSTSSTNAQILDELLTTWEEMGYRFGTLQELVRQNGPS